MILKPPSHHWPQDNYSSHPCRSYVITDHSIVTHSGDMSKCSTQLGSQLLKKWKPQTGLHYVLKGPATCCDVIHPRWNVLKPLRCIKKACDALRWVFPTCWNFCSRFWNISAFYCPIFKRFGSLRWPFNRL